jgi:molybdate transport system permease protein
MPPPHLPAPARRRRVSENAFLTALALLGGLYVVLIVALVVADTAYTSPSHILQALRNENIRFAIKLSLVTCSITAILAVWVGVPLGYLLARQPFRGKGLVEAILDIPMVLPPLVIGLSLLILFQTPPGKWIEQYIPFTFAVPGVILAQLAVACAYAVQTMRVTFEQISPRGEQVARTLGCSRAEAFFSVSLPEARRGVLTAATLAWARSLGEFGPILIFGGATRMKTEVVSTSVFLELSIGNLEAAVAVSMLMIVTAVAVLLLVRWFGSGPALRKAQAP